MVDKNIIRSAFLQKQNSLIADLGIAPASIRHGGAIGEASEAKWAAVLKEFLPSRYGVTKGFAIDSSGEISDQIDLLIYDSQYTPLLVRISDSDLLVPVEAVYAVFEVKQEANKRFMDYAGRKIASVRCLHRTSITIPHAGGVFAPKKPIHILGGLLTTRSGWVDLDGKMAVESITRLTGDFRIDIGCALGARSFNNPYGDSSKLEYSDSNTALLFFLFKLFSRLQGLGTVAAMDIGEYVNFISRENGFARKTYDPGCDQE